MGRVSLTATGFLATNVVLLRKDAGKQLGAERDDLLFDPLNSCLKRLLLYAHRVVYEFASHLHHNIIFYLLELPDSYILLTVLLWFQPATF